MADADLTLDPVAPAEPLPDGAGDLRKRLLPPLDRQVELDLAARVIQDHQNALGDRIERERRWAMDDDQYHGVLPDKTFPWPGCPFSRDTEVLAIDGWRKIDALSIGDLVLTRTDEEGALEWAPVQATPMVYATRMYHFKSKSVDMLVTPEHEMVVVSPWSDKTVRLKAEILWKRTGYRIPLMGVWQGEEPMTLFGRPAGDVCELVGWFLAEGWSITRSPDGVKGTICIGQSRAANPDNCDRLEALFGRLGIRWSALTRNAGYTLHIKTMPRALVALLHEQAGCENKFIPRAFFSLSPPLIRRLLDGLILGDGSIQRRPGRLEIRTLYTASRQMADDVQSLALLAGKRASIHVRDRRNTKIAGSINPGIVRLLGYEVRINHKPFAKADAAKRAIIDYRDFAFCVTVKNHAIYVRRNGIAGFSGNSNFHIPLTRTGVETMKPRLIEAVLGDDQPILVRPIEATDEDRQDTTERFLNWQVMTQLDLAPQVAESAHRFLLPGLVIAKTLWRVEERTLRAVRSFPADMPMPEILQLLFGTVVPEDLKKTDADTWTGTLRAPSGAKRPVTLTFNFLPDEIQVLLVKTDVTYEAPRVELIDLEDFVAPINGGGDAQRLPWCHQRLWLDEQALRRKVRLGVFAKDAVEDLIRGQNPSGGEGQLDSTAVREGRAAAEGVDADGASSVRADEYEVLEHYRRWDLDDDGWDEEIVCWVSPQLPDRVLGWDYLDNLYAHGRRPFRLGRFLPMPGRFYPISFPELIRDLQEEINTIHNQRVDCGTVRNTPGGYYRGSSTYQPGQKPWSPGEWIALDNPQTDVREFQWGGNDVWGANEESTLYQMFERLTGLTDLALGRQPSRVGATRTATGVASLLSESGLRFKTAMAAFQRFWRDIFSDILALDQQYLPAGVEFRVTGRLPEMIRLASRADIAGRFDLRLATTSETLNRSVLREDATIKLQMAMNPLALQLGLVGPKGLRRLMRQFFLAYGETDPDLVLELARPDTILRTPEQEMQAWVSGGDAEPSMAEDLMAHYQRHQMDLQDPLVRETLGPAGIQKVERHLAKTTQLLQMQAAIQQMTQRGGKGEAGGAPPAGEQAKNAQIGRQAGMLGPQEPAGFGGGQNGMGPGGPGGMG